MLSFKAALDIHTITKVINTKTKQKEYQKRYRAFKASRLKANTK